MIIRRLFLPLAAALVAGCSQGGGFCQQAANAKAPVCSMSESQQAAIPAKAEWWLPRQTVTLHTLDTPAKADALRRAVGGHGGMALAGVAVPDSDARRCDIYVALPAKPSTYQLEAIGHELFHCLAGGFHPDMLTGRMVSSYLSPRQAAAQREWFSGAIDTADKQSRWTLSCTFGTGGCPSPSGKGAQSVELSVHVLNANTMAGLARAFGQNPDRPDGVTLTDASGRRCDLYVILPPTYLGTGMEMLGRRMLACFTPGGNGAMSEQNRRRVEEALSGAHTEITPLDR